MTMPKEKIFAGLALGLAILAGVLFSAETPWLKGYRKAISGETIGYHSPYPDATSALLVRATDGTMAIEWETAPVPRDFSEPFATFMWMSGLATQKGAHRFSLSVDGAPLLAFRTGKDATETQWTVQGADGATLSFTTTLVDQFQELFGFMYLKIPRSRLRPGLPLRLKVTGENGGSRDWFMAFQYDPEPWVRANGEQALVRVDGVLCQPVRVEISHIGPPVEATISPEGSGGMTTRLETGYNAVFVPVRAVDEEMRIAVAVDVGGRRIARETVALRPVARRRIFLLPHSHVDIGYSDLQAKVERDHWKYFEQAIELARRSDANPPGARFKWNVEVLWAAETYLRQASPEKRAAFLNAVRKGWIGIQALLANELTGLCHPEELYRLTEFGRRLAQETGVPVTSAMITDIPSYSWSLIPVLAQSGVKYFSSGPNYMPNLADGGDRIGHAMKAWADKPFYWVSPSGKEKVLFWMAGRGYSWFHGLNMGSLRLDRAQPILDYMRQLAASGYPYDMVQVRYTTGGDNGPPDPNLSDAVLAWNKDFESPKIVIATSAEMFAEFERLYGPALPQVRGDFAGYWEDGAASTAAELALNRASANRLLQAETLWALRDPKRFPLERFYAAWRQVVLFDEHTWGAADSISAPDGDNQKTQWAYKRAFALEADRQSEALLSTILPAAPGPSASPAAIDVINTNSWERTDVVVLPKSQSAAGDAILDETGRPVASQRLSTGELAFLAEHVPPLGTKRFIPAAGPPHPPAGEARAEGLKLGNGAISLVLSPKTGAITVLSWSGAPGINFVDASSGRGLNEYLYVPGRDPRQAKGVERVAVALREPGPLVASLIVKSDAPGGRSLERELRLYATLDRLDIDDVVDKTAVREKESVHIAFPFNVDGGTARLDLGWGFIRPDADQIAGACKDFIAVQNTADISSAKAGITWVSLDAPLVEVGSMTDEMPGEKGGRGWKTQAGASQTIYSYAMNNYWHTNYKADQAGPVHFRYAVRPHAGYHAADAVRFGMERARPLLVSLGERNKPAAPPLFNISPAGAIVTSLRPVADGSGWVVRLYNPADTPVEAVLSAGGGSALTVFRSDPFERKLDRIMGPVRLDPRDSVALRLER
jgi:alpha-mannosidase